MQDPVPLPPSMHFIQRDWLSSNHVLFFDADAGAEVATLVDAGHLRHAQRTVSLVREALGRRGLGGDALRWVLNTHLHSDHCGGNAALARAFGCRIAIPSGEFARPSGHAGGTPVYCASDANSEPFRAERALTPGDRLVLGGAEWQVHASPGHDPHSVILHCPERRMLMSADALWENGFGLIFPELVGASGFREQHDVLDLIATLDVGTVIPGHGPVFTDVAGAIGRARQRLAALRDDPRRNARNGLRVMLKYTMLEVGRMRLDAMADAFGGSPVLEGAAQQLGMSLEAALAWCADDLARQGEVSLRDGWLIDEEADHAPDD